MLCSSALPSTRSAFNSAALNTQSGVEAAFSPGRAEQALSEKKGPQTTKTAGFVCEQTVNCDGVSFNLQIHLSTERQPQIDCADQKNEYLFQGLTRYPQDTGYLVTYSVNIQGWLTQLSQGICSRLSFCKAVFELCHPALPSLPLAQLSSAAAAEQIFGLGQRLGPDCLIWAEAGL